MFRFFENACSDGGEFNHFCQVLFFVYRDIIEYNMPILHQEAL